MARRRSSQSGPAARRLPATWSRTRPWSRPIPRLHVTSTRTGRVLARRTARARRVALPIGLLVVGCCAAAGRTGPGDRRPPDSQAPRRRDRRAPASRCGPGSRTSTPGGQTTGFAVAADGSLAIVDRGRQRVLRLDPTVLQLAEWGPRFEPDADAQDLNGIAAAGNDWYLLDRGRARILQLDASGHAIALDRSPVAGHVRAERSGRRRARRRLPGRYRRQSHPGFRVQLGRSSEPSAQPARVWAN